MDKYFLGKFEGERYYLSKPSWDCSWYWGFGYIGNKRLHTHWNYLLSKANVVHWNELPGVKSALTDKQSWLLSELMQTFYALKEAAEVFGRGGSYKANNPCRELLKKPEIVKEINTVLLPAIFEEVDNVFRASIYKEDAE